MYECVMFGLLQWVSGNSVRVQVFLVCLVFWQWVSKVWDFFESFCFVRYSLFQDEGRWIVVFRLNLGIDFVNTECFVGLQLYSFFVLVVLRDYGSGYGRVQNVDSLFLQNKRVCRFCVAVVFFVQVVVRSVLMLTYIWRIVFF